MVFDCIDLLLACPLIFGTICYILHLTLTTKLNLIIIILIPARLAAREETEATAESTEDEGDEHEEHKDPANHHDPETKVKHDGVAVVAVWFGFCLVVDEAPYAEDELGARHEP